MVGAVKSVDVRDQMNLLTPITARRLRLFSGLVLFTYITLHLINHALGIFSLALAESGLRLALTFWRVPVISFLLYGAAAVHFSLALWTIYSRREWHLPPLEILRLASGFSLPLILIGHVVTTRLADTLFDVRPSYASVIAHLQVTGREGLQLALLAPGWVHGCLGLWITLRRSPVMRRMKLPLIGCLVLLPSLAAIGFFRMAADIGTFGPPPTQRIASGAEAALLASWKDELTNGYLGAIAVAIAFSWLRRLQSARRRSER
jgi:adenylate cyclase